MEVSQYVKDSPAAYAALIAPISSMMPKIEGCIRKGVEVLRDAEMSANPSVDLRFSQPWLSVGVVAGTKTVPFRFNCDDHGFPSHFISLMQGMICDAFPEIPVTIEAGAFTPSAQAE